jgi:hypothetical protein
MDLFASRFPDIIFPLLCDDVFRDSPSTGTERVFLFFKKNIAALDQIILPKCPKCHIVEGKKTFRREHCWLVEARLALTVGRKSVCSPHE